VNRKRQRHKIRTFLAQSFGLSLMFDAFDLPDWASVVSMDNHRPTGVPVLYVHTTTIQFLKLIFLWGISYHMKTDFLASTQF